MKKQVIRFEIPLDEYKRARSFHSEVAGLQISDADSSPEGDFWNLVRADNDKSIQGKERRTARDFPMIHIDVSALDRYLKDVKARKKVKVR